MLYPKPHGQESARPVGVGKGLDLSCCVSHNPTLRQGAGETRLQSIQKRGQAPLSSHTDGGFELRGPLVPWPGCKGLK